MNIFLLTYVVIGSNPDYDAMESIWIVLGKNKSARDVACKKKKRTFDIILNIRFCHHGPRSQLSDVYHDKHPKIYRNIQTSQRSDCCREGIAAVER